MTTIISNGYYMIADKRTHVTSSSFPQPHYKTAKPFKHRREKLKGYVDGNTKLVPRPQTTYKGKKVLCLSAAGSVREAFRAITHLSILSVDDYVLLLTRLNEHRDFFAMIMMLEDNTTVTMHVKQDNGTSVTVTSYPAGHVAGIGSGAEFINTLQARTDGRLDKVHPLSSFLFATNTDAGSSNQYDVYGAKEDQYVTDINPTTEEVVERIREVQSHLDLTGAKK